MGIFFTAQMSAQDTYKVSWPLQTANTVEVTGTGAANIQTDTMLLGGTLTIHDYIGGTGSSGVGVKINAGTVGWAASEATWDPTRYIEFKVAPKTGSLVVDQVHLGLACSGTRGYMWAELDWSIDAFTTPVKFDTMVWALADIRDIPHPATTYTIGTSINAGQTFAFRILPWFTNPTASTSKYVCPIDVWISGTTTAGGTGVAELSNSIPNAFALNQNYPNPFNPSTRLSFYVAKTGFVSVKIFDVLGKEIATIVNEILPAGPYMTMWDASRFNSSIYFCKMQSGSFSSTKKMVLVK
jgi:hypothetical protein